jgi:hypothetical protein
MAALARQWPTIANIDVLETDNTKTMIERADALLKAQDDGLKAMEARMSSLFGQSITLATASVAATATTFAALQAQAESNGPASPPWALPWVGQSLFVLSTFWLAAVAVAASSMLSQTWSSSGLEPHGLYNDGTLTTPPNSLRLAITRALQDAIDLNTVRIGRYVRRLAWVIGLLATGPLITAATALCLARPSWLPFVAGAVLILANLWVGVALYRRAAGS